MGIINIYEYIFPVVGGEKRKDTLESAVLLKQVFGTAFSIGSGFFLTAAHVIDSVRNNEWCGIGYQEKDAWMASITKNMETIDEFDLGIIWADGIEASSFSWSVDKLAMSQRILSAGYPYAFDQEQMIINIRAFNGYIVSPSTFKLLDSKPKIYELSFQCPRGLSGAPLFTPGKDPKIAGLIIGNHSTEMLVYSDKEVIEEMNQQTIVERYEALQMGIALQMNAILNCHFQILGCTLKEHLEKHQLLLKAKMA